MLSVTINVKNGEQYLDRCLNALAGFTDVIVLDNYSTDNTISIVKKYPSVRFYQSEFTGMGNVRNLVATYAVNDWILCVDCDEVLDAQLAHILLNYKFELGNIYSIYRKNYYDRMLVTSSSWENDWIKRIYNRTDTIFSARQVHDDFDRELPAVKITGGALIHFPYQNISQLINKMQLYSSLYAKQHYLRKKPGLFMIPFRALAMFFKCYILKRGFLNGYEGFVISSYNAIGVFSKYMKLYESNHSQQITLIVVINSENQFLDLINGVNQQTYLPSHIVIAINIKQNGDTCAQDQIVNLNRLLIPYTTFVCNIRHTDSFQENFPTYFNQIDETNRIIYVDDVNCLLNSSAFMYKCKRAIERGSLQNGTAQLF